jgi:hypothetical protein
MATYLPEARKAITEMLEAAMTAWLIEMQAQSFDDPFEDESLQMMLAATAEAVSKLLMRSPNHDALLHTFALNLLDHVEK